MINRRVGIPCIVALAVAVASCGEVPASPDLDAGGLAAALDGAAYGKATGGGQYTIVLGSGAELPARFSLSGIQTSPDGSTAKGRFHHVVDFFGEKIDFKGALTCLTIDRENGRAWIGGVVTHNTSEAEPWASGDIFQPGKDVWFRVLDSGEGTGSHGRTTFVGFEGGAGIITSAEYCDLAIWPDDNARTWGVQGNVQVLP